MDVEKDSSIPARTAQLTNIGWARFEWLKFLFKGMTFFGKYSNTFETCNRVEWLSLKQALK